MSELFLATTNSRKIAEAKKAARLLGLPVKAVALDIDEIQSDDPAKITIHKVEQAYQLLGKPVVVNDSSWNIPALNGFPGGYMKDVAHWFTPDDFITLMNTKSDRRIACVDTVAYKDETGLHVITKEYWGEIAHAPKGQGNSLEQIALFNGRTIAQAHDAGEHPFSAEDYIWYDFFKFYTSKIDDR